METLRECLHWALKGDMCGSHSLLTLSQLLHPVCFGLGRPLHGGHQLLLRAVDLLLLNSDLLLPLHHLDLDLLQADLLLLFGRLQLVRQLSLCFLERRVFFIIINTSLSSSTVDNILLKMQSKLYNVIPLCSLPD